MERPESAGTYLVCLDPWERQIGCVEGNSIREVAVGRPDTLTLDAGEDAGPPPRDEVVVSHAFLAEMEFVPTGQTDHETVPLFGRQGPQFVL